MYILCAVCSRGVGTVEIVRCHSIENQRLVDFSQTIGENRFFLCFCRCAVVVRNNRFLAINCDQYRQSQKWFFCLDADNL